MKNKMIKLTAVAALAAVAGCSTLTTPKQKTVYDGSWGLDMSSLFNNCPCGHFKLTDDGECTLLWRWGSPFKVESVKVDGDTVVLKRRIATAKDGNAANDTYEVIAGVMDGDEMNFELYREDGLGALKGKKQTFKGYRIADVPAEKPDLSKVVYGEKVDLLAGGIESWEELSKGRFCWSIKDGVLSNDVGWDETKNRWKGGGSNIRTKRDDFLDFAISYDVRVPKGANSGVYLRGMYELQVIDSYGKPVDCHNMAAYYGRVTPSVAAEKPAGEWQHVDAVLYKRHLTVTLNGTKIIDNAPVVGITGGAMNWDESKPGPIYLQGDHSNADFRNMILTKIVK